MAVSGGFKFATAGSDHTCGLTTSGAAYCWAATVGELGDGTTTKRITPVAVSGGFPFGSWTAGDSHTCAVTNGGGAGCWGYNRSGQPGNGHAGYGQDDGSITYYRKYAGGRFGRLQVRKPDSSQRSHLWLDERRGGVLLERQPQWSARRRHWR